MLKAISIRAHGVVPLVFALSLSDLSRGDIARRAIARDHGSTSRSALAVPSSNVVDLYAWMSNDTSKLNLVLTVSPDATSDAWFSSDIAYVFSISSSPALGEPQEVTRIACKFVTDESLECWGGSDYLLGDPREPVGISSDEGRLRVFAGLRNDPFFLEAAGSNAAFAALREGVANEAFEFRDEDGGCPRLTEAQGQELRALLASGESGSPASDSFAGQNVLALVLQVDRSLVDANGPVLGVWVGAYASLDE